MRRGKSARTIKRKQGWKLERKATFHSRGGKIGGFLKELTE
jgi:hypothetical protein